MSFIRPLLGVCIICYFSRLSAQPIDRQALVRRHTVHITRPDPLSSLSVGNGAFAFTVDVTGLQSFPDDYAAGIPLITESQWGWHSFPDTAGYSLEETFRNYLFNGRQRPYAIQWKEGRAQQAADYCRQNPHRLPLGNIGFDILKNVRKTGLRRKIARFPERDLAVISDPSDNEPSARSGTDGSMATLHDLSDVRQELDMWTGCIHSHFQVDGQSVDVVTYCHPQQDAISVQVRSPLLREGRLRLRIRLSYPTGDWADNGNQWTKPQLHRSALIGQHPGYALLEHVLDSSHYYISLAGSFTTIKETVPHYYTIQPGKSGAFECTVRFTPARDRRPLPSFAATAAASTRSWAAFWNKGGIVDFSGSTDPRAPELERRVITSLYLTRIQCAGNQPPQETGLTGNSWYGRPHLEMYWWHAAHFALWGRPELLEKSLDWYRRAAPIARGIAQRQGYEGVRWQKMTDYKGSETPSSVGAFLIWQQPHLIYLAELCYQAHPGSGVLQRYKDLVFATADFMASFAAWDSAHGRYILGKGLIPAQERYQPEETYNPCFELAYWYWALGMASTWRHRLGLPPVRQWEVVKEKLSPLPRADDKYLFAGSAPDCYTNPRYRTDHPSVLCTLGMLPLLPITDTAVMRHTFDWIWDNWHWQETWGWDFPMVAMTATRLGMPEKAIDALSMPVNKNTWLINGHNYQDQRLRLYLPGNGALLSAIALMCAGYKGSGPLPGFPKDGGWKVRFEGLRPAP